MDAVISIVSVFIALLTVTLSSILLSRQIKHMERERNALAILAAIDRLSDEKMVRVFGQLQGVETRYPTDEDLAQHYPNSEDEANLTAVGQYVETVATLARREVIDVSLIVDAVGLMIRSRWKLIREFVRHLRRYYDNPYMFENFEWLARYSEWWKETPREAHRNYDPSRWPDVA
ncbi:MAG: DUF4760 domain-containing protein [Candidatus Eremiobacteraeota bacterium]|nr:DUF4760 domain-containing protein [Candidatus Eremiobacteraeota bacterium]